MHALIENGSVKQYPYTTGDLKRVNPQTSFPSQISDELLLEYGIHRVFFATQPVVTATQVLEEGTPVFSTEDQRWTQIFTVRDMTTEEVQQRDATEAAQVRADRNTRIAATDWTQGKDIPDNISSAWAAYRQALRDVPSQAGFPWTVQWPTQPE